MFYLGDGWWAAQKNKEWKQPTKELCHECSMQTTEWYTIVFTQCHHTYLIIINSQAGFVLLNQICKIVLISLDNRLRQRQVLLFILIVNINSCIIHYTLHNKYIYTYACKWTEECLERSKEVEAEFTTSQRPNWQASRIELNRGIFRSKKMHPAGGLMPLQSQAAGSGLNWSPGQSDSAAELRCWTVKSAKWIGGLIPEWCTHGRMEAMWRWLDGWQSSRSHQYWELHWAEASGELGLFDLQCLMHTSHGQRTGCKDNVITITVSGVLLFMGSRWGCCNHPSIWCTWNFSDWFSS